jgi:choice-of-anchor B domain-containing protein
MRPFLLFAALLLHFSTQAQLGHNMTLRGHYDVDTLPASGANRYNDVWGYTDCDGREYGILGSAAYVHFFDLANPEEPVEIKSFPGGNTTTWRDMKTFRQRAYSVCDACQEGLMIFDLSQLPDTVIKTNQTAAFFQSAHNIYIDEEAGWLYVAGSNTNPSGAIILDLNADPDNPVPIGSPILPGGYFHDIYVSNKTGYCSHGGNGLYVYDFSAPQSPVLLGSLTEYPQSGYNHSSWVTPDGQYAVMADETFNKGLKMLDVSDLSDIQVTDVFRSALLAPADTASIPHNPFIRDNYIFISYYHDGVQVFDMTDPYNVQQVAWYDTYPANTNYNGFRGCWGVYAFLPSGTILGSDMSNGLFVLSLDSILLEPIDRPSYPDPSIALEGENPLCLGESVLLHADSSATSLEWYQNGELMEWEETQLEVAEAGAYSAILYNAYCLTQSDTVEIIVTDLPVPEIVFENDTLFGPEAFAYQWFFNGEPIPGATSPFFVPEESGIYTLQIIDENSCDALSEPLEIEVISGVRQVRMAGMKVYPNPASGFVVVEKAGSSAESYTLYHASGKKMREGMLSERESILAIDGLTPGCYFLKMGKDTVWVIVE